MFSARTSTSDASICRRIDLIATVSIVLFTSLASTTDALAHCLIGGRFLPATLTTDDPCVADELSLPTVSTIKMPGDPAIRETTYSFDYSKSITPDFGLGIGQSYLVQKPNGMPTLRGWDNLALSAKYQLLKNAPHEFILSLGVDADVGGTGSRSVGADSFSTITPQIYFGKGFGDLPDSAASLRPFAVTGVMGYGIPTRASTTTIDDVQLNPTTLTTSFSIQYSLPYLQSNVRATSFGEVFNHLIPLVEISLQTPLDRGQRGLTTGTINPGFIWSEKTFQIGVEALIPINNRTGNNVGAIAQLHFYLDDIFPNSIGKPLFGGRP
jgi:hypothetical protein